MADILDSALSRLGTLLRYIAPGFVALFVWSAVNTIFDPFESVEKGGYPTWAIIVLASLIGFAIYSIQATILVRVFWWVIVFIYRHLSKQDWAPGPDETRSTRMLMYELDTERWRRRASNDDQVKVIQNELNTWSSMLHFLYCSSYAFDPNPIFHMAS